MSPLASIVAALPALLFLSGHRAQASENGGTPEVTYTEECLDLNKDLNLPASLVEGLPKVCLDLQLDTCDKVGVRWNITVDDEIFDAQEIYDLADVKPYCLPDPLGDAGSSTQCQYCVTFLSVDIKPNYAKLCPEVIMKCKVAGINLPDQEEDFPCTELGKECAGSDCESCAATDGCGWCGDGAGSCSAVGTPDDSQPYCHDCDAADWFPVTCKTSAKESAAKVANGDGPGVSSTVGYTGENSGGKFPPSFYLMLVLVALALLGGLCYCVRLRKKKHLRQPAPGDIRGEFASPIQLQDEDTSSQNFAPMVTDASGPYGQVPLETDGEPLQTDGEPQMHV